MGEKEAIVKLKNGSKVFTRMADNPRAVALGVAGTMKSMRKDNHVIDEMIPMIDKILTSSSINYVFSNSVFTDSEEADTPDVANRVLEIYIRWKNGVRVKHDFLISFSADLGSNSVTFAMGWEDGQEVATPWTGYIYQAMNDVVQNVLNDMDSLIDDEANRIRKLSYVNIIQNEINRKIAACGEKNPEDLEILWADMEKTKVSSVSCEITTLSEDVVDIYPVRDFCITCTDDEGNPLFRVVTKVKNPKIKNPDANFETFASFFAESGYSDFKRVSSDQPAGILALDNYYHGCELLANVVLPAIERVIPDLVILQSAIIEQTVNKIGKNTKES